MSHPMENAKFYDGSLEPIKQLKQVIILQSEYEELKQKLDKAISILRHVYNVTSYKTLKDTIDESGLLEKE